MKEIDGNEKEKDYCEPHLRWHDPFETIFIDVDSCLTGPEGIDELADIGNKKPEVAGLTRAAMNGEIPFEEVFDKRLAIVRPQKKHLARVGQRYIEAITPDAVETIQLLQQLGITVYLLSGGYDEAIQPLAHHVGIAPNHVIANRLLFTPEGQYQGFDDENPLCRQGGKLTVIEQLKKEDEFRGRIAIVGDGVGEMETRPAVDLCIGFGGHVTREKVQDDADVFISVKTFAPLIPLLLGQKYVEDCIYYNIETRGLIGKGFAGVPDMTFQHRARKIPDDIARWIDRQPAGCFSQAYPPRPVWKGK